MERLKKVNWIEVKELYSLKYEECLKKEVNEIMNNYEMNYLIKQSLLMKIISKLNIFCGSCIFCGSDNLDNRDDHLILRVFREQYIICKDCYDKIKKLPSEE